MDSPLFRYEILNLLLNLQHIAAKPSMMFGMHSCSSDQDSGIGGESKPPNVLSVGRLDSCAHDELCLSKYDGLCLGLRFFECSDQGA